MALLTSYSNLTVANLTTTGANTDLGNVANLRITGGTNGQFLQTNGSGNLTFATPPSTTPAGSTTQLQYNNAGAFGASANLTFDGTNLTVAGNVQTPAALTSAIISNSTSGISITTEIPAGSPAILPSISIATADGSSVNQDSGSINIRAGNAAGGAGTEAGSINITAGQRRTNDAGGNIRIASGSRAAGESGPGGTLLILGGSGNDAGSGGNVVIEAGNSAVGTPGSVFLFSGSDDANGRYGAELQLTNTGFNFFGNTTFLANSVVNLGNVANVKIGSGTNGQFLRTNGAGNLSFANAVTAAAGSNSQIQFNSNGAFAANNGLTFGSSGSGGSVLSVGIQGEIALTNEVDSGNTISYGKLSLLVANTTAPVSTATVSIQPPPTNAFSEGADYTLTLPANAGSSGQVLSTDGSGNLSFITIPTQAAENLQNTLTAGNTANIGITLTGNADITTNGNISANGNIRANLNMLAPSQFIAGNFQQGVLAVTDATVGNIELLYGYLSLDTYNTDTQTKHGITIEPPKTATGTSYTLTLPANAGSNGQALITTGGGNLSFKPTTFGQFYSNVTQTITAATPTIMTLNNTDTPLTSNVSIVSGNQITINDTGTFNLQFSAQLDRTNNGTDEVLIWLAKNGSDVPWSSTSVVVSGNAASNPVVAAWNWLVQSDGNDYFQIYWASDNGNVELQAQATPAYGPAIPSLIVTVVPVGV